MLQHTHLLCFKVTPRVLCMVVAMNTSSLNNVIQAIELLADRINEMAESVFEGHAEQLLNNGRNASIVLECLEKRAAPKHLLREGEQVERRERVRPDLTVLVLVEPKGCLDLEEESLK